MIDGAADLQRIQAGARVVIGTPDRETVRVSGVFRIGDPEGFLFSLRETLGESSEIVLVRPSG